MIANNMDFTPFPNASIVKKDITAHLPAHATTTQLLSPTAEKAIYFLMEALMRDIQGLKKSLELLTAIAEHNRTDLANLCTSFLAVMFLP